jgi:hypothetical protein
MKTTIDLPDDLALEAKAYAARQGTTLRSVIERGIRQVLEDESRGPAFTLRDASVTGNGLSEAYRDAGWSALRHAAYGKRGG